MAMHIDKRLSSPVQNYEIVLAGRTGSGKSSTGNTILGRTAFEATSSPHSVTSVSSYATSVDGDRTITVVDTPGVHDNVRSASMIQQEIARMAFLVREGVHCFIICMNASDVRATGEKTTFLDQLQVGGHADFYDYCMLVYTKPESELYDTPLKEFLKKQKENAKMKTFLDKIGDRVLAVNNKTTEQKERARNKEAIIAMVDKVIIDNKIKKKPIAFTNDTFKTAKDLRRKVISVVEGENCHPSLINAVIEAVIWYSDRKTIAENEFVQKVITILCNSEQCVEHGTKLVFRNDHESTTFSVDTCKEQIKIIYKAIQSNMSVFYQIVANVRNHKKKYMLTAAVVAGTGFVVGISGAAVVGAILAVPVLIGFRIRGRNH